jgi:hypothetical protein
MMTPEEVDQLAVLCSEAAQTETGKRLFTAIITDGIFEDVVRGHPDPGGLAEELGNEKIIEIAKRELEEMSDDAREQLADDAADHLRTLVVSVAKPAFRAMKNGILESDQLTPDFLITAAAAACVAKATK